jgi:murein peptide amidase A
MRTILDFPKPMSRKQVVADKRATEKLLAPFDEIALNSHNLVAKPLAEFESRGRKYSLPRYVFLGPKGGGDTIRIGVFATIHGDEPEGALALVRLITALEKNPELAQGYALFIYPVCNPTGFEDNTRHSRSGVDLNRAFWTGSQEPEVRSLETEIWAHAFHGIVTLHANDSSNGIYGYVNGAVLSEHLLEPALRSAEAFLPRNKRRTIDGFPARRGIIYASYNGMLQSPKGLKQPPFEITLETPQRAPLHLQVEALNAALQTVLVEYRYLMAVAQNI